MSDASSSKIWFWALTGATAAGLGFAAYKYIQWANEVIL